MTRLTKAIKRVIPLEITQGKSADVAVTLYPNGLIGFRRKWAKREYVFSLALAYHLAAKVAAREIREVRKAKRLARLGA